jgi:glutaminase
MGKRNFAIVVLILGSGWFSYQTLVVETFVSRVMLAMTCFTLFMIAAFLIFYMERAYMLEMFSTTDMLIKIERARTGRRD